MRTRGVRSAWMLAVSVPLCVAAANHAASFEPPALAPGTGPAEAAQAGKVAELANSSGLGNSQTQSETGTLPKSFKIHDKLLFDAPAGWEEVPPAVYAETIRKNLHLVPAGAPRTATAKSEPPLAVFLGPAVPPFQSNLNVREVQGAPRLDATGLDDYRRNAVKAFGSMNTTIESAELITVNGKKALRGEFTYKLAGQAIRSVQAIYAGRKYTYISTYTTLSSRYPAQKSAIDASIESFRLDEPWHAWLTGSPIFLFALVGGVGGGLLALMFKRRNAQLK